MYFFVTFRSALSQLQTTIQYNSDVSYVLCCVGVEVN